LHAGNSEVTGETSPFGYNHRPRLRDFRNPRFGHSVQGSKVIFTTSLCFHFGREKINLGPGLPRRVRREKIRRHRRGNDWSEAEGRRFALPEIRVRLKILQTGDPVLRTKARPLAPDEIATDRIQELIEHMRETMHDAPGVGLAAPQIGVPLQLAVIEDKEEYFQTISAEDLAERERRAVPFHVIINPVISAASHETAEFFEGCLSLAGFSAIVPRARGVRVDCLNERGESRTIDGSGWYARILQHEIDHLGGNLYIDKMRSTTFTSLDNFARHWKGKLPSAKT